MCGVGPEAVLAPTSKVAAVPGAVAGGAGWLVMTGWPKELLTVAKNMSKVRATSNLEPRTSNVWIAFINIAVCLAVRPDLVRLMADCQGLSCHPSKAFSVAQSRHGL